MSIVAWPACAKIRMLKPTISKPAQVNKSEWTGTRAVTMLAIAPRWSYSVEPYPAVDQAQQWAWEAFLQDLDGVAGQFRLPVYTQPQMAIDPGLTVNGGGQTGFALNARASRAGKLLRGMKLTVADLLVSIMADVPFSAGQTFSIAIKPYLRLSPAANAPIEVVRPTALVSMKSPDASWSLDDLKVLGTNFEVEESW